MRIEKPWAPACERNREAILDVLQQHLRDAATVLEIGSGTGQHAVFFAAAMPQLRWQCSDMPANLPGIGMWLAEAALPNTPAAIPLDVMGEWPAHQFDALFSANTLHIMPWQGVVSLFKGVSAALVPRGKLIVYGPFNYAGQFTSASNAAFDASLKARDARQGIRDFEAVNALAHEAGLHLIEDRAMPANNRCLVWQRGAL